VKLDDDGKWFTINVPDKTKVRIDYYVGFDGAEDDYVRLANKAYFLYDVDGYVPEPVVNDEVKKITTAKFNSATKTGFTLVKKDQWANLVEGATFNLYQFSKDAVADVVKEDGTVDTTSEKVSIAMNLDTQEKYEGKSTNADGEVAFEKLDKTKIYYYEETAAPAGYSNPSHGFIEFKRNKTSIEGIKTIAYGATIYAINNFTGVASYSMPLKKTINGSNLKSTEEFNFLMTLAKIDGKDVTPDEKGNVGVGMVYTDAKYSESLTSAGLTKTIKGTGSTTFDPVYFKVPGAYTFEITEKDLTEAQTKNAFKKDENVYHATVTVDDQLNVLPDIKLEVKGDDGNFVDCDADVTVPAFDNKIVIDESGYASWTPKGVKILNGITGGTDAYTFDFEILESKKQVATGKAVCSADNNYKANIEFTVNEDSSYHSDSSNNFVFKGDALGRHGFTIQEIVPDDANPDIDYVAEKVYVTLDVESENGVLKVSNVKYYTTLMEDENTPQFVNEFHNRLTIPTTGINLDIMHYILVFILAGCAWTLYLFRRKKHRDKED
jgi:hypothetical protein